nr:hypothetical protein [uncultured Ottowia sp.]
MFNLLAFLNHVNAKTCLGMLLAQRLKSAPDVVIGNKTPESKARDLQKRLESVGLRVELGPVLSLAASANREKGLEMARLKKRLREQIRAELMKEMGLAPKRRRQRVFFLAGLALLAAVVSVSASLAGRLSPALARAACLLRAKRGFRQRGAGSPARRASAAQNDAARAVANGPRRSPAKPHCLAGPPGPLE